MVKKLFIILLLIISMRSIAAEKWKITSADWQPFSGKSLADGGSGFAVLKEALKTEDIELVIEFYPWTRAINTARDASYVGYFPAWPEEVMEGFSPSAVLFKSPVGFVERKVKPLQWKDLSDLKGKTIGVVQDYGNTVEFNELTKTGVIKTEVSTHDLANIKKVAAGRIDGAFIDLNNLDFLMKYEAKDFAANVQANEKTLTSKDLVVAINNKFSNKKAAEIIKRAIRRVNADKIIKDYNARHLK